MIDFNEIKERFSFGYNYFLIKDYTINSVYIADLGTANFLFGRINRQTGEPSDYLFCHKYFSVADIEPKFIGDCIKDAVVLFEDKGNHYSFYSQLLKKRLSEAKQELRQGIDIKLRPKTQQELEQCRTVRLIGWYKTLNEAKDAFDNLKVQCNVYDDGRFCKDEDMVFIKNSFSTVPKDFKGKVKWSPTARELI